MSVLEVFGLILLPIITIGGGVIFYCSTPWHEIADFIGGMVVFFLLAIVIGMTMTIYSKSHSPYHETYSKPVEIIDVVNMNDEYINVHYLDLDGNVNTYVIDSYNDFASYQRDKKLTIVCEHAWVNFGSDQHRVRLEFR